MDMHSSRSSKRQRVDSTPLSLSHLPANVLSNCFSFLGSSGHYYFLASVCKDFKVAVDELYGDARNTSMDSINTSVSTCTHVINRMSRNEIPNVSEKIIENVFKHDRLDIFEGVVACISDAVLSDTHNLQGYVEHVRSAIGSISTKIMRSMINENEHIIYLLKNLRPPEGMEIEESYDDLKALVQQMSAACDPEMIRVLVEKGVEFDSGSVVVHSLRREDIETFKYLLDIVSVENEHDIQSIVLTALQHKMKLEAITALKERDYFADETNFVNAMFFAIRKPDGLNVVKILCANQNDLHSNKLTMIAGFCVMSERMDILSYLHESIQKIDIDLCLRIAELNNLTEVVNHLRTLE